MVWFLRFALVFTVHVAETDAKAYFRNEKLQKHLEFHRYQVEGFEQLCLSPSEFAWAAPVPAAWAEL